MTDTPKPKSYKIKLISQPFKDEPPTAATFYEAVGRMLMLWGRLENHLDFAILLLLQIPGAREVPDFHKDLVPKSMTKKARLWRSLFKHLPALAPLRPIAAALIDEIGDASFNRSLIVHSAWQEFVEKDPPAIRAFHQEFKDGLRTHRRYRFTLEQVKVLAGHCDDLNNRLTILQVRMLSLYPPLKVPDRSKPPSE